MLVNVGPDMNGHFLPQRTTALEPIASSIEAWDCTIWAWQAGIQWSGASAFGVLTLN